MVASGALRPVALRPVALRSVALEPVNGVLCAGRQLLRSRHLIGTIEQFARAEGCARVRMQGRRGWRRVFKDYSEPFITLEKNLER